MRRRWLLETSLGILLGLAPGLTAQDVFSPCETLLASPMGGLDAERCFYDVATKTGQFDAAITRLQDLLEDRPTEPWLHVAMANLLRNRRDPAIEAHYRRAIELFEARGDHGKILTLHLNLAQALELHSRFAEAGVLLAEAEPLVALSADPTPLGRLQMARARHALRQGKDLALAAAWARGAIAEATAAEPEDAPLKMRGLSLLATISYELGRRSETRQCLEEGLDLALANEDLTFEAQFRFKLAVHQLATTSPSPIAREDAKALLRAARSAAERASNLQLVARADLELGKLEPGSAGDLRLTSCTELATELGIASLLAQCQARQAVRLVTAQPAHALLAQAVATAAETGDPWTQIYLWPERLRLAWTLEPYSTAIEESWNVLATIEALRAQQGDGEGRAELMSIWSDAYDVFMGYLLDTPGSPPSTADLGLAFEVGERRRARVLLEDLQATFLNDIPPPDLNGVEGSLEADEALLIYQLAHWENIYGDFAGGSWVWAITRQGSQVYRLTDRAELEPAVRMLVGLPDPEQAPASLTRLYQELLAPVLVDLPATIERLIVVPDGILHELPFGVLRPTESAPPLALRYGLSSVPSAALWLRWRQQGAPASQTAALIFADPAWQPELTAADQRDPGASLEARLGPLPHARQEGRMIRRLLSGSELLLGQEATEARLKHRELNRFSVLHFAAHAVVNQEAPGDSALFLAPGSTSAGQPEEDGRVVLEEIAQLDLDGQMVVLSACDSAGGRVVRGEGVMGLARSFFRAGARVVVASLKPLADDQAARFFAAFYRHLRAGKSVDTALADAQRERIEDGATAAEWASMVVLGEGRLVPFPGGLAGGSSAWLLPNRQVAGLAALGLVLLGLGVFAFRRAHQRGQTAPR